MTAGGTTLAVRASSNPPIPVHAWLLAAVALLALTAPVFLPINGLIGMALAIGIAVLPLAALFAFRQPFLLCLVFVIFSFFRIHEAFPLLEPLRIPQLMAAPTIAILAWRLFGTRTVKPYWSRELTALSVFFGLVTVGMFFAVNKPMAVGYWSSTYVKIFAMVLVIAWLSRHEREFALVTRALVIAGILIAAVALYNKANEIGLVEGTRVTIGRNIGSVLGDPNDLSLVLLFPLSFAVALMATRAGWFSALLGLVGSVMIVAAIIATQSRGGLLGSVAVAGIVGFCISGTFLTQGFTWPFYIQLALVVATSQFANEALRNATAHPPAVPGKPAKARKTAGFRNGIAGPHRADRGSR